MTQRLHEVLTQARWFQDEGRRTPSDLCLGLAICQLYGGTASVRGVIGHDRGTAMILMGKIVAEMFPERLVPFNGLAILAQAGGPFGAFNTVMVFNDHPQTTFQDIEKVMDEFERRKEAPL